MIRYGWGLDSLLHNENFSKGKNRNDHRHHAIDAFVVALTDRSLLQRMSSEYEQTRSKIKVPDPWSGFRGQLKQFINDMVVSYKPDHGTRGVKGKTTGQLHNETAYGIIELAEDGRSKVVRRRPLSAFKSRKSLEDVPDLPLRNALERLWDEVGGKGAEFASRAANEGVMVNGRLQTVRRVRVEETETIVPIRDTNGKVYKGYKLDGNEFADIWQMSDENKSWKIVAVPRFYANQPDFSIRRFPAKNIERQAQRQTRS